MSKPFVPDAIAKDAIESATKSSLLGPSAARTQSSLEFASAVTSVAKELTCARWADGADLSRMKDRLSQGLQSLTRADGSPVHDTPEKLATATNTLFSKLTADASSYNKSMEPTKLESLMGKSAEIKTQRDNACAPVLQAQQTERSR